eukprot:gene4978-5466_t
MQVLEALSHWANVQPNKKVWTFLNDKGDPVDDYSYEELDRVTSSLAEHLINTVKLTKGDRVLLVFFPGLDFTVSLLACFKAQLIAVPVFPPDPRKLKKDLHHFISIQNSSNAKVALTNQQFNFLKKVEDIKNMFSSVKWPEIRWIAIDDQLKKGKATTTTTTKKSPGIELPSPSLDTIAFLQFTSGSTSEPKGVMISHQNLRHNLTLCVTELKANQSTVNVSWLPQYHDMGLIGSYLGALYCGGTGYYLSPISFLKDPVVWLRALSRFSGTHTQAPNFAYALAARKFREYGVQGLQLDLSSVCHMINAAEPVDFKAILDFYSIFQSYGLKNDVIVPTYGLAEHTVFVCSGGRQVLTVDQRALLEENRIVVEEEEELVFNATSHSMLIHNHIADGKPSSSHSVRLVGCGYPGRAEGVHAKIVSTAGEDKGESVQELPEGHVGEIWLDSPSKAQGYWEQKQLSEHDFHAQLPTDTERVYLRTGDMGFMYKSELFICGRSKDLIILGGSNHYPQDIERTVEQGVASFIRAGCSAAFAIAMNQITQSAKEKKGTLSSYLSSRDGNEVVIYMAELKDGVASSSYPDIAKQCVSLISAEHGLSIRLIILLPSRTIPKTTSGKIARSWCKRALLSNTLDVLFVYENPNYGTSDVKQGEDKANEAVTNKPPDIDNAAGQASKKNGGYETIPLNDEGAAHGHSPIEMLPLETIRGMDHPQLVYRLQQALQHVMGATEGKVLDEHQALIAMGVDSISIAQFKGIVEKRFYCDLPDEFLFSSSCNLHELAIAVHGGSLMPEQIQRLGLGSNEPGGDGKKTTAVVVDMPRQPLCPWFFCCY